LIVSCEETVPFALRVAGPKTQLNPGGRFAGQAKLRVAGVPAPAAGVTVIAAEFPLPDAEEITIPTGLIAIVKAGVTVTAIDAALTEL
jgi:hypothetical protein